jgi:DNA-binding response OmpR family regulator
MNGVKMVQNAHEKGHHFPVIVLSAHLDKKAVMDGIENGVVKFLEKPIGQSELLEAINVLLTQAQLQRVQTDIYQLTGQLRELYTTFSIACEPYLPIDVREKLLIELDPHDPRGRRVNFDLILDELEEKLSLLISQEKSLKGFGVRRAG